MRTFKCECGCENISIWCIAGCGDVHDSSPWLHNAEMILQTVWANIFDPDPFTGCEVETEESLFGDLDAWADGTFQSIERDGRTITVLTVNDRPVNDYRVLSLRADWVLVLSLPEHEFETYIAAKALHHPDPDGWKVEALQFTGQVGIQLKVSFGSWGSGSSNSVAFKASSGV